MLNYTSEAFWCGSVEAKSKGSFVLAKDESGY